MKLTRRGLFGVFASAIASGFAITRLPAKFTGLTFKGVPLVFDEYMPTGTIGGIDSASFKFWRNRHDNDGPAFDALQAKYEEAKYEEYKERELGRIYNEM